MSYSHLAGMPAVMKGGPVVPAQYTLALLIGGPFDGVRRTVQRDVQIIREAEFPQAITEIDLTSAEPPSKPESMALHDYHRQHFNLSDGVRRGDFALFLHESIRLDVFDVVQALFEGYRQPKGDR